MFYYVFAEDSASSRPAAPSAAISAVKRRSKRRSQPRTNKNCIIRQLTNTGGRNFSHQNIFLSICRLSANSDAILSPLLPRQSPQLQYSLKNNFESSSLCVYTEKHFETIAESRVIQSNCRAKLKAQVCSFRFFLKEEEDRPIVERSPSPTERSHSLRFTKMRVFDSFRVLCCSECDMCQVVKGSNAKKWGCKVCGLQQSVRKIYVESLVGKKNKFAEFNVG